MIYDDLLRIITHAKSPEEAIRDIRLKLGGLRIYFPRLEKPEILPNDTPNKLKKRYGVSRQTANNWLNRYKN